MKKYLNYVTLTLIVFVATIASCDQEQEVADIISPENKAVVTIDHFRGPITGTTIKESDEDTVIYHITMDKMQPTAVTVSARQIGGTADAQDFTVVDASIAPFTTTGELLVLINKDIEPEELETLELEVGPFNIADNWQLNLSNVTNQTISLSIENFVSDDLNMIFAWDTEVEIDDTVRFACDSVDLDIFIAPAAGFDINDPWADYNQEVMAATGNCPEELTFSGLADGAYVIFANLWVNRFNPFAVGEPLPITATFTREGVFLDKVLVQTPENAFSSDMPGDFDPEYAGGVSNVWVAKVTIANGVYTIEGPDATVVASGRSGRSQTSRPAETLVNK